MMRGVQEQTACKPNNVVKTLSKSSTKGICHKQSTSMHNHANQLITNALVIVIGGVFFKGFFFFPKAVNHPKQITSG